MISRRIIKPSISMISFHHSSSSSSSSSSYYYSSTTSNGSSSWDPTASLSLNHPTLILLEKCETIHHLKQILCQMMRVNIITQTFPMSRLLYFSAVSHPQYLNNAILLFNHFTPSPNLFIFNTMISALSSFSPTQSLRLYMDMLSSCICPDHHTLLWLLKTVQNLLLGMNIHAHAIVFGIYSHSYLQNSLVKMYVENGKMGLAHQLFEQMGVRDLVSYNIMISGYGKMGCVGKAFELFDEMVVCGIEPDQYTMVGFLVCCGHGRNVLVGKSVHGLMVRRASLCNWSVVLSNALIDMYAKFEEMNCALKVFEWLAERDGISWNIIISGFARIGELDIACSFFDEAPAKDLVSWNCLLAGCVQKGDFDRVTELFKAMVAQNIRPDEITAIALVRAASEMGILNQGRCVHGWAFKLYDVDAFLGSALIDMYSKCGSIERSLAVFRTLSYKDVAVWTAMITGLAFHGHGIEALRFFHKMKEEGIIAPNSVTFIAVLIACSHAGLVEQGYEIFRDMKERYGIEPGLEHYGCLVDLFARSGRVKDALDVIRKMPMKPSESIWGAILGASKVHKDLRIAEDALRELMVLEPDKEGGYVLLSNVYASCGQWRCSDEVREIMGRTGVKKMAGCSSLVVGGVANEFVSADKTHPRAGNIYSMLDVLHREMKSGAELI